MKLTFIGTGQEALIKTPANERYCSNVDEADEDGTLCSGLNIAFGPGYREECCDLYLKCC